jgi:ribosomal protein S12 methylthiotransferase accessory factor
MKTLLPGKDAALEDTIEIMSEKLKKIGIEIEVTSWLNPVPHVWSVHIRDKQSPMCFTNGKGSSKNAALASALGEYFERLSCNYFYADWFFGEELSTSKFTHYPNEKWFPCDQEELADGLMDDCLRENYDPNSVLKSTDLIDTNSGNKNRGICALPFERQSDKKLVYIPVNVIGNLYVSNGMSAGNTKFEARVQCLSEIFERYVKNTIIMDQVSLPQVPLVVLERFPIIIEAIA